LGKSVWSQREGITTSNLIADCDEQSVFNLTRALTPLMEKSPQGASVINLGSVQGLRAPTLDNFAYSTSKAAVHHLTKHLAIRLADKNIRVNAIGMNTL
jgi:NAD(P)-dependent dehydrogenase (short-subunit alcohol dehydrogenase family)